MLLSWAVGVHGAGTLHDLSSRGLKNICLIEKKYLASGTSSKSTKLIHGGIRYLQRPGQMKMVYESLRERRLLLELAPDLVKPLEFLIPLPKKDFLGSLKIKIGLTLYDFLAKKSLILEHKTLSYQEALSKAPLLNLSHPNKIYSYWDAQTDDKLLVKRVADSAQNLGASILEETEAISLKDKTKNWEVTIKRKNGEKETLKTNYIINCLGPWSNNFLEKNHFTPTHQGKNNKGVHLILRDFGLKAGLLLSALDKRIFFVLPWNGKTLIGTTESAFKEDAQYIGASSDEISYLLKSTNQALNLKLTEKDVESSFAGLRWLAEENGVNLTRTSRESILGKIENKSGFILTVYGGKLTSYRNLCEKIGDELTKHKKIEAPTKTHMKSSWLH